MVLKRFLQRANSDVGDVPQHRGAYLNAIGEQLEFGTTAHSVYLWTLPMFHCNGWCFTWGITAMGATDVCLRKVVPEEIFRIVAAEGVTHLCAAPTILIGMSAYATEHALRRDQRPEIMTAGAPPAPTVIQNMEGIGANVTQTYGLTEVYGPHSVCQWQRKWGHLSVEEKARLKARLGVPYIVAHHAVIPVPDPKWGEVPKAFVVPKPGRQPEAEEIIAFCKQHLARFKAPKYVAFGELPKTATGKIQKYKLREREWKGHARQVN